MIIHLNFDSSATHIIPVHHSYLDPVVTRTGYSKDGSVSSDVQDPSGLETLSFWRLQAFEIILEKRTENSYFFIILDVFQVLYCIYGVVILDSCS